MEEKYLRPSILCFFGILAVSIGFVSRLMQNLRGEEKHSYFCMNNSKQPKSVPATEVDPKIGNASQPFIVE
eukprot:442749-Amphidinium_carterae.1